MKKMDQFVLSSLYILTVFIISSSVCENITVGYLMADQNPRFAFIRNKQGRLISGAMTYAITQINNSPDLLAGHTLSFSHADTRTDTLIGTRKLTDMWKRGAQAFFGPEDSCATEARVAAAWNLPMISYKCADPKVSDKNLYPTFARTFPPATQVTKSILALLLHYSWTRVTLVVGTSMSNKFVSIADKFSELAAEFNITINGRFEYQLSELPTKRINPFPRIVEQSYIDTRIYVYFGEHNGMIDLLSNLDERGLLATGEYMVIHTDFNIFNPNDPMNYFQRTYDSAWTQDNVVKAAQSLLVIVPSPPTNPNYDDFHDMVHKYNSREPFKFPDNSILFGMPRKTITVYAAYLYDAVMLYAHALDEVLKEGGSLENGTAIIEKIKNRSYRSIQGFLSFIDENGDAEGNYTVLSRTWHESQYGNYSMKSVGHFQTTTNQTLPSFFLLRDKSIDWVRGAPPVDMPECGYRGEFCIPETNYTLEIAGGVLGGIVLIASIIGLVVYRNWRYEQEIAGLLWMVRTEDIQGLNRNLYSSRTTLASQNSFDSRISLQQIFTVMGMYKGQLVAVKKFTKRGLDVTRRMKKEMKMMKDLRHDNVNNFVGACLEPPHFIVLTEYCSKGSLQDILENDDVKLDSMFIASLVHDLIKGMQFLHDSELHTHGNLKSSNCVVTSRWSLQVADYGLYELRQNITDTDNEHAVYRNKLWTAPELLRNNSLPRRGTQKADVYAFGIILYEILGRSGPFGECSLSPKEIVERVKTPVNYQIFRPDTSALDCQDNILQCMNDCWQENFLARPDFRTIRTRLKSMREGMKTNIFDNMMMMMEKYQSHLEDLVADRTEQLMEEKKKTEGLLHRMLPKSVADPLIRGQAVVPEAFASVTIYFSDICGFTALSAQSSPMQVVDLLNDLYTTFDSIIKHYDVYKVETIGDAYMVVSGLPIRNGDNHAGEIASMSLRLLSAIKSFRIRHRPQETLKLRIGIHSGSCVAGVVGLTMPRYCLFGDCVNTASRMESNGEALKIHVSPDCREILLKLGGYTLKDRGYVSLKGKGEVFTYWLTDEDKSVRKQRMDKVLPTCVADTSVSDTMLQEKRSTAHRHSSHGPHASSGDRSFFELMREHQSDSTSLNRKKSLTKTASGGISAKRRSNDCLNSQPSLEHINSNGYLNRVPEKVRIASGDAKNSRELTVLPSIVIDKENTSESPQETDQLLGVNSEGPQENPNLQNAVCMRYNVQNCSTGNTEVTFDGINTPPAQDYNTSWTEAF